MQLKEILKNMIRDYFIITTAILVCTIVFCSFFNPDAAFTLAELKIILLLGALTDLPTLLYYSKRELTGKEFEIRFVMQVAIIAVIVVCALSSIGWMDSGSLTEIAVVTGQVCSVSALIRYGFWRKDKSLSDKINQKLSEIRENRTALEDIYDKKTEK